MSYREDEEDCADGEGDDDLGEVLVGRRPAVPDPHAQGQGTDQAAISNIIFDTFW